MGDIKNDIKIDYKYFDVNSPIIDGMGDIKIIYTDIYSSKIDSHLIITFETTLSQILLHNLLKIC